MPKENFHRRKSLAQVREPLRCQYPGRCSNERTVKTNGELHWLCEKHRDHQNAVQRERYRRNTKKKKTIPTMEPETDGNSKQDTPSYGRHGVEPTELSQERNKVDGRPLTENRATQVSNIEINGGGSNCDSRIESHHCIPTPSATEPVEVNIPYTAHPQTVVCPAGTSPMVCILLQTVYVDHPQPCLRPETATDDHQIPATAVHAQDTSTCTQIKPFVFAVPQLQCATSPYQHCCHVASPRSLEIAPQAAAASMTQSKRAPKIANTTTNLTRSGSNPQGRD